MILKLLREGLGRVIIFIDFVTRPKKMQRSAQDVSRVNGLAKGLALYQFYGCPFCVRVRRAIHKLNVPIELRDAQNNAQYRNELEKQGGDLQVPCLRIEEKGKVSWLYESGDIIQFLKSRFS